MAKICHISTVHRWNDIRIFQKQCVSLAKEGNEVHLIIQSSEDRLESGVFIHALRPPKNRLDRALRLTKQAMSKARELNADLYQVHDPELLPIARQLQKEGLRVVYDAHENAPASILDKPWIPLQFVRWVVSKLFDKYERNVVHQLSGVISVASPLLERFDNTHKQEIQNLPVLSKFTSTPLSEELEAAPIGIAYAGGLSPARNIHQMILAMPELDEEVLHLFGPWESEPYRQHCMSLKGWSETSDWGFRPNEEVYTFLMQKGKIGMIVFDPNIRNHRIALPNKAFEYMAAGVPIIMSDIPYWREHFGEVATFVDPNSPESIANGIRSLLNDEQLRQTLIAKGKHLVANMNWDTEYERLKAFYQSILS